MPPSASGRPRLADPAFAGAGSSGPRRRRVRPRRSLRLRGSEGFFIDPNEPLYHLVSIQPPLGTGASLTDRWSWPPLVAGGVIGFLLGRRRR